MDGYDQLGDPEDYTGDGYYASDPEGSWEGPDEFEAQSALREGYAVPVDAHLDDLGD